VEKGCQLKKKCSLPNGSGNLDRKVSDGLQTDFKDNACPGGPKQSF